MLRLGVINGIIVISMIQALDFQEIVVVNMPWVANGILETVVGRQSPIG